MEAGEQLKNIQSGHICLILCCMIYLIWWSITFNPMKKFPILPKIILLLGICIFAIFGYIFLLKALVDLPNVNRTISNSAIIVLGIMTYILLLYITSHFLHRPVTTELFLIVGCSVLELCIVSSVYGASVISLNTSLFMVMIIIVVMILSMICYILYYNLKPVTAFYVGMIPLTLFAIVMGIQIMIIR